MCILVFLNVLHNAVLAASSYSDRVIDKITCNCLGIVQIKLRNGYIVFFVGSQSNNLRVVHAVRADPGNPLPKDLNLVTDVLLKLLQGRNIFDVPDNCRM